MTLSPLLTLAGGPAAIAVHDYGDVAGEMVEIDIRQRDVIRCIGKVLNQLLLVAQHVLLLK